MSKYAKTTQVSVERSKLELEKTLVRYGAVGFFSAWQDEPPMHLVGFKIVAGDDDRMVKISLPLPRRDDFKRYRKKVNQFTDDWATRSTEAMNKAWETACRQKWRALCLVVKAKLEAVDSGISTIEREFLADVVLPDGTTFGQWARPQLATAYSTQKMPPLLPGGSR